MKNRYRSGRIQEGKVASRLKELGFTNIRRSEGSRGPADLYARSPTGVKSYVQVKSGRASVSPREVRKLRSLAKQRGGMAITAERRNGKTRFRFRGSWNRAVGVLE